MHGGGLLGNHHSNSKPQKCPSPQLCPRAMWARRRTCTMLLQRPLTPEVCQWFAAKYAETCSKSSFWQQIKLLAANKKNKKKTTKSYFRKTAFTFWRQKKSPKLAANHFLQETQVSAYLAANHWHTLCNTNTYQIANAAQSCKQKCCMLTNHLLTIHLHDTAPVPCHACSFVEFSHKSFQVKRAGLRPDPCPFSSLKSKNEI